MSIVAASCQGCRVGLLHLRYLLILDIDNKAAGAAQILKVSQTSFAKQSIHVDKIRESITVLVAISVEFHLVNVSRLISSLEKRKLAYAIISCHGTSCS